MKLEILYATQTGNAEEVAQNLSTLAKSKGFIVNINEMNHYTMDQFRKFKNVAIVTSTYGNGEVPEMGIDFWEELKSSKDEIKAHEERLLDIEKNNNVETIWRKF